MLLRIRFHFILRREIAEFQETVASSNCCGAPAQGQVERKGDKQGYYI